MTKRKEKTMEASNVRAMYDALVKVKRLFDGQIMFQPSIREAHKAVNAALAAPPRNCDLYTVGEALRKYGFPTKTKPWGEKEWLDFCEWLVSEVEAEAKGE